MAAGAIAPWGDDAAGLAGRAPPVGAAGAGFAAALLLGMMDVEPLFPPRYARVREVSMKMIAALVVSLLMKVLLPPAPKTD